MKKGHLLTQKEIEAISHYKIDCDITKKERDLYAQKLFDIDESKNNPNYMDFVAYGLFFVVGFAAGISGK
jgi:hypothetical protein